MLRRCLCVRFSPKCIFASFIAFLLFSILMALVFNINHDFGQSRSPIDFLLYKKRHDSSEWKSDLGEGSPDKDDDDGFIYRGSSTQRNSNRKSSGNHNGKGGNHNQAFEVVNLLKKMQAPSSSKPISDQTLKDHVDFLYQAIVKDGDKELPPLTFEPKCAGGIQKGEVEDLLCIPRPKYLEDVKNLCWYGSNNTTSSKSQHKLNCLPYFHILGCAKSGTTDLWNRLMAHPHIISNNGLLHKEALWWGWRRFGIYGYKKGLPQSFKEYVDLFEDTARLVQSSITNNNHYHKVLITGDASPPDFWDFRGWRSISQNRGLAFPQVLTPHMMKHFYPDPKFILMFKDPIDRLYSDYFFLGLGLTSEDFHHDVVQTVALLADCVRQHDLRTCFYDNALYKQMKVRLPFSCYSVFMKEWLQVFPLKHFLFLKTEEYQENEEGTLKEVMNFLGLQALKEGKMHEIAEEEHSRVTLQKQVAGPMKAKTQALLSRLLNPCSQQLAKMIGQSKFVWETS